MKKNIIIRIFELDIFLGTMSATKKATYMLFEFYLTCSDPSNNAIRYALSSGAVMAALYP